ncbi:hypothetical protein EKO27_g1619 [Xylaria grammica]|uniref:CHAT domain-containing protein n=1 Tax=Xylaria grammica TaxID=363999 RepID=A0A439DGE1_9PEZI|nr:hypothetical protein EKO27_g1619 [Xylaria grammica]
MNSSEPAAAASLDAISRVLIRSYEGTRQLGLLLQATTLSEQAVAATGVDSPMRTFYLSALVNNLTRQFQHTGNEQVLDSAIKCAREALAAFSGDPRMRWAKIQNVAFLLETRIKLAIGRHSISQAVELAEEAVGEIPDDHANHTRLLGILSEQLWRRYKNGKQERDLFEAIERGEEAVLEAQRTMLSNPSDRSATASILCRVLEDRYLLKSDGRDVQRLISLTETISVNTTAQQVELNFMRARYLAWRYGDHGGPITDLTCAVELSMSFLNMPRADPNRIQSLDNVIYYFCMKYDHAGQGGLDELTALIQAEMDQIKPKESQPQLKNLYLLQMRRYVNNGDLEVLNEAIHGCERALDVINNEDEMWAAGLSNLGCLLRMRYERLGESDVLEEAIERCNAAVDATREKDPLIVLRKTNLALCLAQKYVRTTLLQDLRPVIKLGRDVLEAVPERNIDRFKYLNILGVWLSWSYMQTKDPCELDECIARIREAAKLAPPSHIVRHDCLNNLCASLKMRHDRSDSGSSDDLEDAIKHGREAVTQLPSHHPMKARALRNLFEALKIRYEETHNYAVRDEALAIMKECIRADESPPSHRLNFVFDDAVPWLEAHDDWRDLSEITESATELLGRVSPRSLRQQDQQYLLRRYAGLASTAAAAALQTGKSKEQALMLLEQGRGTITSTLLQNRRSISSLKRKHPEWAKKFEELRDALDPPLSVMAGGALGNALQASPSTIVVINVANFRCDAFLIQSNQVSIVDLPDLTHQVVEAKAQLFRSGKSRDPFGILEWLWDAAIERILVRLGADKECVGHDYADWPRVYWVPTGPLRLLPIHAAGYHRDGSGRSVLDRVVSSYSLSVEEILYGQEIKAEIRQVKHPAPLPSQPHDQTETAPKFVLVSMERTPGNGQLPYAPEEVNTVREMLPPCLPRNYLDQPSRDSLLRAMVGCTVFHFAGHGVTDRSDPSLSGLLLGSDDGNSTIPLTVRDLQALRFHETGPPLLAYLSACSTGRIDDDQLVDEGIHLMGACRLAGFRHVIGSLWEVSDRLCVEVAKTVYETILKAHLDDASVAHGLHHAVRMLRAKLDGIQDGTQRNGKKRSRRRLPGPSLWAAFIHIGV